MNFIWYDNGQTHLSNRLLKQLHVTIGRIAFGWDTPFHPYIYVHPKWSTPCCGGMGTGCQHEDIMYEIEHGGY